MDIGLQEIIVIMVIVLLLFGPKKLPEIGRSLGRGLREFRRASNELMSSLNEEEDTKKKPKTFEQEEGEK
jgi:sec-independent protein translocase protein TatA